MANVVDRNPLALDTVATIFAAGEKVRLKSARWVSGAAAAGHTVSLTNAAGTAVLWTSTADGANFTDESLLEIDAVAGLRLNAITSGTLYVMLG